MGSPLRWGLGSCAIATGLACSLWPLAAAPLPGGRTGADPGEGWRFRFGDFAIAAWWPPDLSDAELRVYADAGFNLLHYGRYCELDDSGRPKAGPNALDLAPKYGLSVLWDTYAYNHAPWGNAVPASTFPQAPPGVAAHHHATPPEFRWLVERIAGHPALAGFLLADDVGTLPADVVENTAYLRARAPHLIPWVCQNWSDSKSLAAAGNPIHCVQTYPTLYERGSSAEAQMLSYCGAMARWREAKRTHGLRMWPIFDVSGDCSDSLVRFQVYAAIAYGADGIWYFTYNGGGVMRLPDPAQGDPSPAQTMEHVRKRLRPSYGPIAETNWRVRAWGPRLLQRTPEGIFSTREIDRAWPFPEDYAETDRETLAQASPGAGKLIREMSPGLIAGVLVRRAKAPLMLVVDCRVSKQDGALAPREVQVHLDRAVTSVRMAAEQPGVSDGVVAGRVVRLMLRGGEGRLLELAGERRKLARLCSERSIYGAGAGTRTEPAAAGEIRDSDLTGARAARIAFEVAGSDGAEQYHKPVLLNGRRIGILPANSAHDHWQMLVMEVPSEVLPFLRRENRVTIESIRADAWKLRGAQMAVQKPDGTWVRSAAFRKTYASEGWALFEGEAFPEGSTLEIPVAFSGE